MDDSNVKQKIKEALWRSAESLKSAEVLFRENLYRDTASRAYYAAFHAIQALILLRGKTFSSHRAVISYFNKNFIQTGVLPGELAKIFGDLFAHRQIGDYRVHKEISQEQAKVDIQKAIIIINEVKQYIEDDVGDATEKKNNRKKRD